MVPIEVLSFMQFSCDFCSSVLSSSPRVKDMPGDGIAPFAGPKKMDSNFFQLIEADDVTCSERSWRIVCVKLNHPSFYWPLQ